MVEDHRQLQSAVLARFEHERSWSRLSQDYSIPATTIRRAYRRWVQNAPKFQPQRPEEIHIPTQTVGCPHILTDQEETLIVQALRYFAQNNTPLTKCGVQDLVQHYIELMPVVRQEQIKFKHNRPSLGWVSHFVLRHDMVCKAVRIIDEKRLAAVTEAAVSEHIARVKYTLQR